VVLIDVKRLGNSCFEMILLELIDTRRYLGSIKTFNHHHGYQIPRKAQLASNRVSVAAFHRVVSRPEVRKTLVVPTF
jgi:hypothetical protein